MEEHVDAAATRMTADEIFEAIDALNPKGGHYVEDLKKLAVALSGLDPADQGRNDALTRIAASLDTALEAADLDERRMGDPVSETGFDASDDGGLGMDASWRALDAARDAHELSRAGMREFHALLDVSDDILPDVLTQKD